MYPICFGLRANYYYTSANRVVLSCFKTFGTDDLKHDIHDENVQFYITIIVFKTINRDIRPLAGVGAFISHGGEEENVLRSKAV